MKAAEIDEQFRLFQQAIVLTGEAVETLKRDQPTPDPESARRALCAGLHALKLPVRMAFTHTFIGVVLCHILIVSVVIDMTKGDR